MEKDKEWDLIQKPSRILASRRLNFSTNVKTGSAVCAGLMLIWIAVGSTNGGDDCISVRVLLELFEYTILPTTLGVIGIIGAKGVVITVAVADWGGGRSGVSSKDSRVLECGKVAMAGSSIGSWLAFFVRVTVKSTVNEFVLVRRYQKFNIFTKSNKLTNPVHPPSCFRHDFTGRYGGLDGRNAESITSRNSENVEKFVTPNLLPKISALREAMVGWMDVTKQKQNLNRAETRKILTNS
uniref:Uncharacterized protein n=1 Tax=Glossina pallidipes TaxID=7398 RepID=A0A1B0ACX7_GLOPL